MSFGAGKARDPYERGARGPLRIVVLSPLASGASSTRALPPPTPVAVDKLSFDRVMGALGPSLAIDVKDPFTPEGEALRVELLWTDFKAMRADGIANHVPALRALTEARKIVLQVKAGRLGRSEARAELTRVLPRGAWAEAIAADLAPTGGPLPAKAPAPVPAKVSRIDALFDKVAVAVPGDPSPQKSAAPAKAAPTAFSALVAAVAAGGSGGGARAVVVGTSLERVERAFGGILREVLRHPEVHRLERAWRGLRLLVDHADARAGVEIDVIPVAAEGVAGALRRLFERPGAVALRAPIDLLVVDDEVGASERDSKRLRAWAELAMEHHTPLVVNGEASLIGREAPTEEACRWVAVAVNGPLVRPAYTSSSHRLSDMPFREDPEGGEAHVFAGPAMAIAALSAESYVRTGWPSAIVGPRDGVIASLPVHEVDEAGQRLSIPIEVFVDDAIVKKAARAGIALFACAPNHDSAILACAPMFHERAESPDETLGNQLFVGRFASAVEQIAGALPPGISPTAGASAVESALGELFRDRSPAGPEIEARIVGQRLEVTIRPRRVAGITLQELTLGAPLA